MNNFSRECDAYSHCNRRKREQATFGCTSSLKELKHIDIMRKSAADIKGRMNEKNDFVYRYEPGRIHCR